MLKNKLNNYLIQEVIRSYIFVLFSFSFLIWITQAAKYLNLITESGLAIKTYLFYIILIFPKIISQMMVVCFLISLFLTIIKLIDTKELEIYWLAGISKIQIALLIFKISFFFTIFAFFFYLFLVPHTNFKSREILSKSEFSMVNSLVKQKNFNSPLKKLTIFINKNDNKGNLEKIYIFEQYKTIIAKKGRVINIDNKNYLELIDGFIHEKNKNNNITVIKFEKTIFDFTKYQTNIMKDTKLQERKSFWLVNSYFKEKDKNTLEEIYKRIFKPLMIPVISIFCCFLLFTNNEKINLIKLRIIIFSIGTFLIIFMEILIKLSVKNILFNIILYFIPLFGLIFTFYLLNKFLENEPTNS